jgi:CelD/BcsL family acetyltransferase involved in cellulose biosynthesis
LTTLSITAHNEISALEAEWEALSLELEAPPFLRPGWFAALSEGFGLGPVAILAARRGRRLVGVLPLLENRGALESLTNWHTPWFQPLVEDEDAGASLVLRALADSRRRLDLSFLPRDDPRVERTIDRLADRGAPLTISLVQRSPYADLTGGWEEFEASRPPELRRGLRRRGKRFAEEGAAEYECHRGDRELERLLADGFAIEAAGWKGREGTAIETEPGARRFYESVARWAAEIDALRLWFLRVDGRGVAFAFCLVDRSSIYGLKVGFDPDYARFGPGQLLTREIIIDAFSTGLHRYEFLGKDDRYKLLWADGVHDVCRLRLYRRTPLARGEYLSARYGRPLAKRALERAGLLDAIRRRRGASVDSASTGRPADEE